MIRSRSVGYVHPLEDIGMQTVLAACLTGNFEIVEIPVISVLRKIYFAGAPLLMLSCKGGAGGNLVKR